MWQWMSITANFTEPQSKKQVKKTDFKPKKTLNW
jgi:hypothetical protein